jgi:aryl-alcohol dehydrogenase-like predicted oxidoreductase
METVKLGKSGLEVSRLCLGGMSFGDPNRGNYPWTLPYDESKSLIRRAFDNGINFIDTANSYSDGSSEEIIGKVFSEYIGRDNVVLASKVYFSSKKIPNSSGLSRKCIFREIDLSLKRLNTDYIDLYQIHRWDDQTPIEETLEALSDLVKIGKVRYLGASSMATWQFVKAVYLQKNHGWAKFISMQGHLNLVYREEEREMLPFCNDEGIGYLAWSPLARGRLARPIGKESYRIDNDAYGKSLYEKSFIDDKSVIETASLMAQKYGVSPAEIALAWIIGRHKNGVPILGVTKEQQLDQCINSLKLKLSEEDLLTLESNYVPHSTAGY